jgi:wobble nucleotide-excising tRNase
MVQEIITDANYDPTQRYFMTIKSIATLSDFGIFKKHTNKDLQDFGKYNLIFGWNGSGKSTLAELFHCIECGVPSAKFPTSQFSIALENGKSITPNTISGSNLNICTFNQDFISENISWDSHVKSILLVDKTNIIERKKLEQLQEQQKKDNESHLKEKQEIKEIEEAISKFGTDSARHLKNSLQSIDTTDKYYLNYDKRKFETFISSNLQSATLDETILAEAKVRELTKAAKPEQKADISFSPTEINQDTFIKAKSRLEDLLKSSIVSKVIERLAKNSDIKNWVETGIEIHKNHNSATCEFCGNKLPDGRIAALEDHFNDEYKAFQDRLTKADEWLRGQYYTFPSLPAASDFYDEFKTEYVEASKSTETVTQALNKEIQGWHSTLQKKISNPLDLLLTVNDASSEAISAVNTIIRKIKSIVDKHNHKSKNFQQETSKAKKQLELHYAATEVQSFKLDEKKKSKETRSQKNNALKTSIDARGLEIKKIEDSLTNESLGADQFNASLHKFLGRSELTLRFNAIKKGYEILRDGSQEVRGKLSEGEKTAIAFVYFITKIAENDNKIKETIVVVDDPVSSFDSNHLFHAYSFLRNNCHEAKQIFVLTHNFTYFAFASKKIQMHFSSQLNLLLDSRAVRLSRTRLIAW